MINQIAYLQEKKTELHWEIHDFSVNYFNIIAILPNKTSYELSQKKGSVAKRFFLVAGMDRILSEEKFRLK